MNMLSSRFFIQTDAKADRLFFKLPNTWWSRPYEYEWAKHFANPGDIVLDAACGISHPFKFFLSDRCKEVHACDMDPRIVSPDEILQDIKNDFGREEANRVSKNYFEKIQFIRANLTSLPYMNKKFDKIFCISVLEHLDFNILKMAFAEFRRVLKDDGVIVVTFDYPAIHLESLQHVSSAIGLDFCGDVSFEKDENAVYTDIYFPRLYCYRAVFKKRVL